MLIVPNLPTTMPTISITVNNKKQYIYSRTVQTLHNIIASARSLHYWRKHQQPVLDQRVDLDVLHHATKNTPTWNKLWLTKWQSGHCGVEKHLQQWRDQTHSRCPRCQTENETVHHVLHCQHNDAINLWTTGIEDIEIWIRKNGDSKDGSKVYPHPLKIFMIHKYIR